MYINTEIRIINYNRMCIEIFRVLIAIANYIHIKNNK